MYSYYILNTKTDENFDPIENKFFPNSWEPQFESDKLQLELIMQKEPERFKDCEIVEA